MVYLITGKKGAGKSHHASELKAELEATGQKVHWIDGDVFRMLHNNTDYSYAGRKKNLEMAAKEAAEFENQGYIVLMSFVMPSQSLRDFIRKFVKISMVVYIPGGTLWEGTTYERPSVREMQLVYNY